MYIINIITSMYIINYLYLKVLFKTRDNIAKHNQEKETKKKKGNAREKRKDPKS
jgi:hypothetical protein